MGSHAAALLWVLQRLLVALSAKPIAGIAAVLAGAGAGARRHGVAPAGPWWACPALAASAAPGAACVGAVHLAPCPLVPCGGPAGWQVLGEPTRCMCPNCSLRGVLWSVLCCGLLRRESC